MPKSNQTFSVASLGNSCLSTVCDIELSKISFSGRTNPFLGPNDPEIRLRETQKRRRTKQELAGLYARFFNPPFSLSALEVFLPRPFKWEEEGEKHEEE